MGSLLEFNDTLKISKARGFPQGLCLENHVKDPESSREFLGQAFPFWNPEERVYHRTPTPVKLVEETQDKKWIYWGHAVIEMQTMGGGKTTGNYRIVKIYHPDFQRKITVEDAPSGKSYFTDLPTSLSA